MLYEVITNRVIVGLERSYGAQSDTVSSYAGIFLDALEDHGVLGVLKHFPGHGRITSYNVCYTKLLRFHDVVLYLVGNSEFGGFGLALGFLGTQRINAVNQKDEIGKHGGLAVDVELLERVEMGVMIENDTA